MRKHYLIIFSAAILLIGCSSQQNKKSEESQNSQVTPDEKLVIPDVVYGHKHGVALTFDVFKPKKQNGAGVILINSGGWFSPTFPIFYKETAEGLRLATDQERAQMKPKQQGRPRIKPLLDKGFTVFDVRHGSSPNFEMSEIVADLRRAIRFIRFHAGKYNIDAERLGLWGGSAGGYLALLLGTTADVRSKDITDEFEKSSGRVAAIVAYFPPADLKRWGEFHMKNPGESLPPAPAILALKTEQFGEFSPINFVSSDDPPTLIVHGDQDQIVPILEGQDMYQALLKAGVKSKFVTIPGVGHGFTGQADDIAMKETVNWFEEHLKAK